MCFHGNQYPWAIKHPFISLYSKYQSLKFICLPVMNSPVFPSLDNIYCIPSSNTEAVNRLHIPISYSSHVTLLLPTDHCFPLLPVQSRHKTCFQ